MARQDLDVPVPSGPLMVNCSDFFLHIFYFLVRDFFFTLFYLAFFCLQRKVSLAHFSFFPKKITFSALLFFLPKKGEKKKDKKGRETERMEGKWTKEGNGNDTGGKREKRKKGEMEKREKKGRRKKGERKGKSAG